MLITILTFLLVLGFLVLVHELGHFLTARKMGVSVEEFGLGFPPRLFNKKIKTTVYSLNLIPLGGFVKIKGEDGQDDAPDSFASQSIARRMVIVVAGVTMNLIAAWLLIVLLFLIGAPRQITPAINPAYIKSRSLIIKQVLPGSPAERVGLQPGDEILQINGQRAEYARDLRAIASRGQGQEIKLTVQRQDEILPFTVMSADLLTPAGEVRPLVGVGLVEFGIIRYPPHVAFWAGTATTISYSKQILTAFGGIFRSVWSGQGLGQEIGGPVAIAVVTGSAVQQGLSEVLILTAILSLNLAFINILPFPALDGGRLIFLLAEKLMGKPSRQSVEAWFHRAGFALLMLFAIFITYRDLVHFGGQIWQAVIN